MIIYSHNLHEKLFGYAISREFIKYQTPFCDLLDDPNLALDFDLAIKFNQAINSSTSTSIDVATSTSTSLDVITSTSNLPISPATNFTNTLILCSTDLDVTSLNFYKQKMKTYPIFAPEIARINFIFGNLKRLPSDNGGFIDSLKNAVNNCLNSPCNLFTETSDTVGKLSQGTLFASNGTTLPIGDLKDSFSTFAGGISTTLFNKVPNIIQKSITGLKFMGKQAWSESMTMLAGDSLPELVAKAQSGTSLRTSTAGYRYTPDLKSYLDLSEVSSEILGGMAAGMGDCFRRYQHSARYNPYDPAQNLSDVSRSPVQDTSNGIVPGTGDYSRTLIGQSTSNVGGNIPVNLQPRAIGNKQEVSIPTGTFVSDYFDFQTSRDPNMITIYGGYIDSKNNWYQDLTLDTGSQKGDIAATPKFKSGPMVYNAYKQLVSEGWSTSKDLANYEANKFNIGIAINFTSLVKYLNAGGRASYTEAAIKKYFYGKIKEDDDRLYVEITPEGRPPVYVKIFDIAGSPDRIDFTVPAFIQTFGIPLITTGSQTVESKSTKPSIAFESTDTAKFDNLNVITTFRVPPIKCKARFIVGKLNSGSASGVSGVGSNAGTGGTDKPVTGLDPKLIKLIEEFKIIYPNITVTSAYRSPSYNEKVGGASKSQHTLGNAIDLSVRGISMAETIRILEWWKARGAHGFGYYPNSTSIHVDIRESGAYAAWGTNYSRSSLPQTPKEFQAFARSLGVQW